MDTLPPLPLKRRLLHAAERALYWSGAGYAYARAAKAGGATILMYHSVADAPAARFVDPAWHMTPTTFERQMRWLHKHRHVIALDALVDTLARGETPPVGSVVLTFDDGYLDNYRVAAPILAKYDLPATLYLATGYVEMGETQWVDHLYTAFRSRRQHNLQLPGLGAFDLSAEPGRLDAYGAVSGKLIESSRTERRALLEEVRGQLAPEEVAPRLTMTWDEAKQLASDYPRFELAVHTVDHADLSRCDEDATTAQLKDARQQIEARTGRKVRHFSSPYSRATAATRRIARNLGFDSATGAGTDFLIRAGADPFDLSRLDAKVDATMFKFWTSGAFPALPQRLLGRA